MGVQSKTEIQQRSFIVSSNTRPINMKAFVAMLATVAAAAAEPWLGYGYAGLPLVYGKSAPCVNAANQSVPCAAGHVLLGKRDAEAEPWLGYGYGVPLVYGKSAPCVNAANQPVPLLPAMCSWASVRLRPSPTPPSLKSSLPSAMPRLSPGWVMVMASPLSMASLLPASTLPTSPSRALPAMCSWASVRLRPSPTPPSTLSTPLVPGTDTPPTDSDKSSSTPQT